MSPELSSGHFVAKRIEADYIASAKLGDLLEVRTELLDMKGASFVLKQTITKEEKKIFELVISLVYIDFQGRPKRIDQEVKQLLLSLF
jgi:acyl-CoA thioester hydrolase